MRGSVYKRTSHVRASPLKDGSLNFLLSRVFAPDRSNLSVPLFLTTCQPKYVLDNPKLVSLYSTRLRKSAALPLQCIANSTGRKWGKCRQCVWRLPGSSAFASCHIRPGNPSTPQADNLAQPSRYSHRASPVHDSFSLTTSRGQEMYGCAGRKRLWVHP